MAEEISAGCRLGPYEVLGPLGAGGMGEVYRARDPRLGRDVAIKVLPSTFSKDPDRLRRFEQEARAAGILSHPNITAVYDVGSQDGAPYVVSELLEGESLQSLLAGDRLSTRRAIGFAIQLALEDPSRYSHVIILGTGSLLPPQTPEQVGKYEAVQARVDKEMAQKEPTVEDARKLLQADTFNHSLISDEDVALRHRSMIGRNFKAHQDRQNQEAPAGGGASQAKPLWQRLTELKMPLLMIFGREDRAHAGERAELLKTTHPELKVHIVNGCKHMVHWDAFDDLMRLGVPFLKS